MLGAIRVQLLAARAWRQWDQQRLHRTGGTLEQYKHPCLIADPKFRETIAVEEELAAIGVDRAADVIGQAHGPQGRVSRGLARPV